MHPEDRKKHHNPWYCITHYFRIQTKTPGVTSRLKLNPIQKRLARIVDLWNYHLVLKARQEGVSTFFLIWHLYWTMFRPNTKTCILADDRDNLTGLFQIIRFAYESCPNKVRLADGTIWTKPEAKYDNRNELFFEGINSTIYVALKIRSKTVHRLHVSEWAFIKNSHKILTATFAAVPKDGVITGETTANGMGGSFFEEWDNENSRFIKHFFGYQDHPDYCDPVDDEAAFALTLTEDERKIMTYPNMKLGNIAWRRRHLSIAANRKEFDQEYPATAELAFLTSGRSPFNREKIKDWIILKPKEERMEGRLLIWKPPEEGRRYVMATDTASGRGIESLDQEDRKEGGTDYNVIQVVDCVTHQLVAMFRGKWPYAKLHEIQYKLGKEYHFAYNVTEATDHGLTVINNFQRDYIDTGKYPRQLMHSTQYLDAKTKKMQMKYGFYTNLKTKPLVLDRLAEAIEDETLRCHSSKVQSECLRFEIKDDGKMGAMDGYHDDTVMTLAIALYNVPNALRVTREVFTKKDLGL